MTRVVCFGEALVDFLNIRSDANDGITVNDFRQFPGGAPANVAVAVAKLGGDAWFAGQVGADSFGDFLKKSLHVFGVKTDFVLTHPSAETALAFVFLDKNGERSFTFRRKETADLIFVEEQISADWFGTGDIFHFCSNTLTEPAIARVTAAAARRARNAGNLVSFDVNIRHNLWPLGSADSDAINRLFTGCDIIKLSRDEFDFLCEGDEEEYLSSILKAGTSLVLITDGGNPVRYHGANYAGEVSPGMCEVVDTTAAGDGFTGALLFGLNKLGGARTRLLDRQFVASLVEFATACGAFTVRSAGAFPSLPTFGDVENHWSFDDQ